MPRLLQLPPEGRQPLIRSAPPGPRERPPARGRDGRQRRAAPGRTRSPAGCLGDLRTGDLGGDHEREVEAGRDAPAGEDVAVANDARALLDGADHGRSSCTPSGWSPAAPSAGPPPSTKAPVQTLVTYRARAPPAHEVEGLIVGDRGRHPKPPGTQRRSSCGQSAKVAVGTSPSPQSQGTGASVLAGMRGRPRQPMQDLQRPRQVELRQSGNSTKPR